jgi:hypothetical protein
METPFDLSCRQVATAHLHCLSLRLLREIAALNLAANVKARHNASRAPT